MKPATKPWHGRTFGQHISKVKIENTKSKNTSKKKKPTLLDLNWTRTPIGTTFVYITPNNKKGIKIRENVFYEIWIDANNRIYFCTSTTWKHYQNVQKGLESADWVVIRDMQDQLLHLYKLLTMDYYES